MASDHIGDRTWRWRIEDPQSGPTRFHWSACEPVQLRDRSSQTPLVRSTPTSALAVLSSILLRRQETAPSREAQHDSHIKPSHHDTEYPHLLHTHEVRSHSVCRLWIFDSRSIIRPIDCCARSANPSRRRRATEVISKVSISTTPRRNAIPADTIIAVSWPKNPSGRLARRLWARRTGIGKRPHHPHQTKRSK